MAEPIKLLIAKSLTCRFQDRIVTIISGRFVPIENKIKPKSSSGISISFKSEEVRRTIKFDMIITIITPTKL